MPWDSETDLKLVLNILAASSNPKTDWEKVVEAMGSGYTKNALQLRFGRIKRSIGFNIKEADDQSSSTGPNEKTDNPANTKSSDKGRKRQKVEHNRDSANSTRASHETFIMPESIKKEPGTEE